MAVFEFVMVSVSIIIGLAMAEISMGVLDILRAKAFDRTYWIHTAWVVQYRSHDSELASQWELRAFDNWNYATLSMALAPTVMIFLAAGLISPKKDTGLREYYFAQRSTLFTILLVLMVLYSLNAWTLYGHAPGSRGDSFRLLVVAAYVPLAISKKPKIHAALTMVHACIITVSFTTLLGGQGGKCQSDESRASPECRQ